MKVCSFLPAATHMMYSMGLQEYLYGVTFECISDKPKIVRSYLEGNSLSSEEINQQVSNSMAEGKSLYYIDEELLQSISPDVVFTQDVCDVCQIDTSLVQQSIYKLHKQPQIIPLIPKTLNDVYQNAMDIASALGKEEIAVQYIHALKKRTDIIAETLQKHQVPIRKAMVLEWLDPMYNCGHWIPDQILLAGGVDLLSNPGGHSNVISWNQLLEYDPEVLVIAPCGFNVARTMNEMNVLSSQEGWSNLSAVKNNRVYIADAEYFTQPGLSLVDGIELLAAFFHPTLFQVPQKLFGHFRTFEKTHSLHD